MAAALPDYVTEQRNTAQSLGEQAGQINAQSYNIQDELKKIMDEFTVGGKTDWSGIQGKTMSDYLQAPMQAMATYEDPTSEQYIFNPAKAALAQSYRIGAAEAPMLTASNLMGLFTRGEADIIGAQTRDFQAKAAAQQAAATAARQAYSDTLAEFQWQQQMDLEKEKFDLQKQQAAKTGGKSSTEKLADEKRQLIQEAAKLPESERQNYILSNGFNPNDTDFSGLFTPGTDWDALKTQSDVLNNLGLEGNLDWSSGKLTPVPEGEKAWWQFWK